MGKIKNSNWKIANTDWIQRCLMLTNGWRVTEKSNCFKIMTENCHGQNLGQICAFSYFFDSDTILLLFCSKFGIYR